MKENNSLDLTYQPISGMTMCASSSVNPPARINLTLESGFVKKKRARKKKKVRNEKGFR